MPEAKVEAVDVSVRYRSAKTGAEVLAIDGLSLSIAEGEFVAIVGPSGCGKTTFLECLDGLLPITGGEIRLDGNPVVGPGRDRAVAFQSPNLLPWRTVLGNITYGLELQHVPVNEAMAAAEDMLRLVGLEGFGSFFPGQLSGGMQQRVNLGRALVVDPEVLLLDEPFSALDAQTRELMQAELMRIWLASRKTTVLVTHQIDEAVYLADRVFVLSARPGRVREILAVPFPRPRDLSLKRTPEFLALTDQIWRLVVQEVDMSAGEPARGR